MSSPELPPAWSRDPVASETEVRPTRSGSAAPRTDKRKAPRYPISPSFPIKTVLSLADKSVAISGASAPGGRVTLKDGGVRWKDWPATLIDLSATGANLHVNLAAVAFPEDPCRMKFSLGSYRLEIPGTVAHYVCDAHHSICGVQFNFAGAVSEKAFLQILEPVIIGTTLVAAEPVTDAAGRRREDYHGKNSSVLSVWRPHAGGEIHSFDFRLNRYGVRWNAGMTELMTYRVDDRPAPGAGGRPAPKFKLRKAPGRTETVAPMAPQALPLTEAEDEEARWLFCLAVSNLSTAVASDARGFLLSLVVA